MERLQWQLPGPPKRAARVSLTPSDVALARDGTYTCFDELFSDLKMSRVYPQLTPEMSFGEAEIYGHVIPNAFS
jgi:hypothetical protein